MKRFDILSKSVEWILTQVDNPRDNERGFAFGTVQHWQLGLNGG